MQLRILPLLIVVAVATLGMRVGEIWTGVGNLAEAQSEVAAGAEVGPGDPFDRLQLAEADGDLDDEAREAARDLRDRADSQDGLDLLARADYEATARDDASGPLGSVTDPFAMTDEEIELLQQLAERREALERRAGELRQRESVVQAAEKRLEEKIADLESLKATIEDLLLEYDDQQDRQLARLVNIYERMEPQDAARIFEDLEMPVLLKVVDRMNERRTAPILAQMDPEKAQALTLELAERRELPIPRE